MYVAVMNIFSTCGQVCEESVNVEENCHGITVMNLGGVYVPCDTFVHTFDPTFKNQENMVTHYFCILGLQNILFSPMIYK